MLEDPHIIVSFKYVSYFKDPKHKINRIFSLESFILRVERATFNVRRTSRDAQLHSIYVYDAAPADCYELYRHIQNNNLNISFLRLNDVNHRYFHIYSLESLIQFKATLLNT